MYANKRAILGQRGTQCDRMNDLPTFHLVGLRSGERKSFSVRVSGGGGYSVVVVRVPAECAATVVRRGRTLAGRVPTEAQTATLQNDVYVLSAGGVGKGLLPDALPRCVHKVTSQNSIKPQSEPGNQAKKV